MTVPAHEPYADAEPVSDLVAECRCVEAECAARGVDLHPAHHDDVHVEARPVVIDDATQHLVDGYPDVV